MFRGKIRSSLPNVVRRNVVHVPPSRGVDFSLATTSTAPSPDPVKERNHVEDVDTADGKTTTGPNLLGVGGKENVSSTADSNNPVVPNSDIEEVSVNEKRAAKRKKQKENKSVSEYDVQKLSRDSWTLESALKYCGLGQKPTKDSTEVKEEKKKAKKCPNKQAVGTELEKKDVVENDSGFGDWHRHEALGLASMKNGLITPSSELSEGSENEKNISECSEVMSHSELDVDDILRSLVTDETAGDVFENVCIGIDSLPNTLDQRSSVTDSSGVETSSDADSDHAMFVADSADHKSDVPNGQHPNDLHLPEDSACEQEVEFITVSKKRKPKSLQVNRNGQNTPPYSSANFVSPDSGESSPRQEQNAGSSPLPVSSCAEYPTVHKEFVRLPESSLSPGSTADTWLSSELCVVEQSATSFDVRHQPSENFSLLPKNSPAEKRIADHDSMYLDSFSSRASLSDFSLDDFAFSCLLKESLEDDWTVVKNGRRSRNNVQSTVDPSSSVADESKQSVPINVGQCSVVVREHTTSEYGRGKASTHSGRGRWSTPNSRCKSFDGSNSKTFDRYWHDNGMKSRPQGSSQRNVFPSGVARSSSSTEPKNRDTNCDILSRCNSNKEVSLLESNSVRARCQEIPRFTHKFAVPRSDVPVKDNCATVASSSEVDKTASMTMTAEATGDRTKNTESLSSEKTRLSTEINKSIESSNSKLSVAEKTLIRHDTFNLIEAQIYMYREYQEVLKERQRIPHLVVIYDPDNSEL